MNDSNYDEFGNYLGPEILTSSSSSGSEDEEEQEIIDQEMETASPISARAKEEYGESTSLVQYQSVGHSQIVLHEDKKYYPEAEEVFGQDVEVVVNEEDAQPLSVPLVTPVEHQRYYIQEDKLPETVYNKEYLVDMMGHVKDVRHVAIAGHMHHGKTRFVDMMVSYTHYWKEWDQYAPRGLATNMLSRVEENKLGYTMISNLERKRGISTKSMPLSVLAQNSRGKSKVISMIDTPGHCDFIDEVAAALRLVDGVVVVVDAAEGVMSNTAEILKAALREGVKVTVVINKMDRLILELKLPPRDAYFKLRHTIEEINTIIQEYKTMMGELNKDTKKKSGNKKQEGKENSEEKENEEEEDGDEDGDGYRISPELGNVCFSSAEYGWCFSLESMARKYLQKWKGGEAIDATEFASRLWGDIYYDRTSRRFVDKKRIRGKEGRGGEEVERTFVEFILEPIYKIHSYIVGEEKKVLKPMLEREGIWLGQKDYDLDVPVVLRKAMQQFIGFPTGFVDMLDRKVPNPIENAARKIRQIYTGSSDGSELTSLNSCSADGPLMIYVTKTYSDGSGGGGNEMYSLGRILSGEVREGQKVVVLHEGYTVGDEEETAEVTVEGLYVYESRYKISVRGMRAGNIVLIRGVSGVINKVATISDRKSMQQHEVGLFRTGLGVAEPTVKVAVEPANPAELPKMLIGLRLVNKTYPSCTTKVEESGEHVVLGTGEMAVDCMLHDLRLVFGRLDINVSDPVVVFRETVAETSAAKCYVYSTNRRNKVSMICEPLEETVVADLANFNLGSTVETWTARQTSHHFAERYGWDLLSSRNIICFGPHAHTGPNVLINDTMGSIPAPARQSIKQGFLWAAREGPLVEEEIRGVKFRLTDSVLADQPILRGSGQLIPAARKVCYASFLAASPKLLEPYYFVEITSPADCVSAVYNLINSSGRRGVVTKESPKPGTPLYLIEALIPVIDSFGFETDLRIHTNGACFCSLRFDHWQVVPGNIEIAVNLSDQSQNQNQSSNLFATSNSTTNINTNINGNTNGTGVKILQRAVGNELCTDFLIKTRRRKGLGDNINIAKYVDNDPLLLELLASNL